MDVNGPQNNHPSTERLNAFVEAGLGTPEQARVEAHLAGCPRCRDEVAELRSVFTALSEVPRFAPSLGFADRVMADVRVRQPAVAGAAAWAGRLERLVPQSTRGWAAAAAILWIVSDVYLGAIHSAAAPPTTRSASTR